jgi:hypothetical protein
VARCTEEASRATKWTIQTSSYLILRGGDSCSAAGKAVTIPFAAKHRVETSLASIGESRLYMKDPGAPHEIPMHLVRQVVKEDPEIRCVKHWKSEKMNGRLIILRRGGSTEDNISCFANINIDRQKRLKRLRPPEESAMRH